MNKFKITLCFNDIDENLYTKGMAKMTFDVEADDYSTAFHLGQRLQRSFNADELILEEV
jgi:hypothetical protein